jgi:hypothetical protein
LPRPLEPPMTKARRVFRHPWSSASSDVRSQASLPAAG